MAEIIRIKKKHAYALAAAAVIAVIMAGIFMSAQQLPQKVESRAMEFLAGTDAISFGGQAAGKSEIIELGDGDTFRMSADAVSKEINGKRYVMYGYNGMIPGPTLRLKQGSRIKVVFTNNIDQDTTIHWHGLRHENKDDGVPGMTQKTVKPGETYTYDVYAPDEGVYWYHPHAREDVQQDAGLYGNIIVAPSVADGSVDREELLAVDDILVDDGKIVPYDTAAATHALMGRFGTVMLVNGETDYRLSAGRGEVIRFYVTNTANTRTFNISMNGAMMKLVGSDIGRYEREAFAKSVVIAPAERYIVDVLFNESGTYRIVSANPHTEYELGTVEVSDSGAENGYGIEFLSLKENADVIDGISGYRQYFGKAPDYSLKLTVQMDSMMGGRGMMAGMPCHRMPDGSMMGDCGDPESIEWEDDMGFMNANSGSDDVRWIIQDNRGNQNMDIPMNAKVGDVIKIRVFNDPNSMHPMQHPIHLHGQRFLVLRSDKARNDNLAWKDTVLIENGETVELIVDASNPGEWMLHCHIAEHLESGMMAKVSVTGG